MSGSVLTMNNPVDTDEVAISAHGLVKRYGELTAVAGIDFEVKRGKCLGELGPNGAGKTTTIEILEGLKVPDEGDVIVLTDIITGFIPGTSVSTTSCAFLNRAQHYRRQQRRRRHFPELRHTCRHHGPEPRRTWPEYIAGRGIEFREQG